jgi:4-hydroxy-3-polyprenylbenzoate decarboxylase
MIGATSASAPLRLVVGITGATGAVLGVRLLERLREHGGVEVHLIMSRWAHSTLEWETSLSAREVAALAAFTHPPEDLGAAISSDAFPVHGMVIIPCSMTTLAVIRAGCTDGLISRAADITLRQRRKLVLVPRKTPLNDVHLENMLALSRRGAVIQPPMPAFSQRPETVNDLVGHTVDGVLDQFGLEAPGARRRPGLRAAPEAASFR